MSKKSRRRNKRLLALAGLAGAVALSAKRKRNQAIQTGIQSAEDDKGSDMAPNANKKTDYITKKDTSKSEVVAAAPKKINNNTFRTRQRTTDSAGNTVASAGTAIADNKSKVTDVTKPGENMYSSVGATNPRRVNRKSGGRAGLKSGGKVKGCGKALRGFGRAMKR